MALLKSLADEVQRGNVGELHFHKSLAVVVR